LRTDLLELWVEKRLPIKAVLLVTHNIEEAVLMCDKVIILSSNPGRIATELHIDLPHPRNRLDVKFREYVDQIYARMTQKPLPKLAVSSAAQPSPLAIALPHVSTNALSGFLEVVSNPPFHGKGDLPHVADELTMEIDELFPVAEMLHALRFAEVAEGDVKLTDAGQRFVTLDTDDRKKLFRAQLLEHIPLAAHIRKVLDEQASHRAPASRFREELEDHLSEEFADITLRAIINLGRYAELFAYDEQAEIFSLEDPN
jgi:NitT/TauT family transport system ATP-binding protein